MAGKRTPMYNIGEYGRIVYHMWGGGEGHDKVLSHAEYKELPYRDRYILDKSDLRGYSYTKNIMTEDVSSEPNYKEFIKLMKAKDNPYILNMSTPDYLEKLQSADESFREEIAQLLNNATLLDKRDVSFDIIDTVDEYTTVSLECSLPTEKEVNRFQEETGRLSISPVYFYKTESAYSHCFVKMFGYLLKVHTKVYLASNKLQFSKPFVKNAIINALYITAPEQLDAQEEVYPVITGIMPENYNMVYTHPGVTYVEYGAFEHIYYKYLAKFINFVPVRLLGEEEKFKMALQQVSMTKMKAILQSVPEFYDLPVGDCLTILKKYQVNIPDVVELSDSLSFNDCILGLVQELSNKEYGRLRRGNNTIKQIARIPVIR